MAIICFFQGWSFLIIFKNGIGNSLDEYLLRVYIELGLAVPNVG